MERANHERHLRIAAKASRRDIAHRRNLTIQLSDGVVRQAKVLAAREGTSVSKLVASTIERLVKEDAAYEAARRRALEVLARPFRMGGRGPVARDELHDR